VKNNLRQSRDLKAESKYGFGVSVPGSSRPVVSGKNYEKISTRYYYSSNQAQPQTKSKFSIIQENEIKKQIMIKKQEELKKQIQELEDAQNQLKMQNNQQ
jgi:hypothetical protein